MSTLEYFSRSYSSVDARSREVDTDFFADFKLVDAQFHRSRMTAVDHDNVRLLRVWDTGGMKMNGAVHDDAIVVAFLWGERAVVNGVRHDVPLLSIMGPGTELRTHTPTEYRYIRIGLRKNSLAKLRDSAPRTAVVRRLFSPGIHRLGVAAKAEFALQERIAAGIALADRAARYGLDTRKLMALATEEATGALADLILSTEPFQPDVAVCRGARRKLVSAALDRLEAHPMEPVSVSALCAALGVTERSLERAFQECLGISPRSYERERRLRAAHGAIVAEGDQRSVTEIAMSFGFWHLGRFSSAYATFHGCSPSETRRRFWSTF